MVHTERRLLHDQRAQERGQVAGPRRLAPLVVDDVEGVPLGGEPQHRAREVGAVCAVEPGGAHDVATEGAVARTARSPAALLRPYALTGASGAFLGVRRVGVAGEDVVGRDVHQPAAPADGARGPGWQAPTALTATRRASSVSAPSTSVQAAAFTTTSTPSTAVAAPRRGRGRRGRRGSAPTTSSPASDEDLHEVAAEHAAGAGDQPARHRRSPEQRRARLERLPPVRGSRGTRRRCRRGPASNGDLRGVAELAGDLGDVDGVAAVVALAVRDVVDRVPVGAARLEQPVGELLVGQLGPAADVVDLAGAGPSRAPAGCRGSGRRRAASRAR